MQLTIDRLKLPQKNAACTPVENKKPALRVLPGGRHPFSRRPVVCPSVRLGDNYSTADFDFTLVDGKGAHQRFSSSSSVPICQ